MSGSRVTTRFRFWLWLIRRFGVIVPRRLRADWRQEWEAELQYRELLLADWDKLNWKPNLICRAAALARSAKHNDHRLRRSGQVQALPLPQG
jgi:hypothetical protein